MTLSVSTIQLFLQASANPHSVLLYPDRRNAHECCGPPRVESLEQNVYALHAIEHGAQQRFTLTVLRSQRLSLKGHARFGGELEVEEGAF